MPIYRKNTCPAGAIGQVVQESLHPFEQRTAQRLCQLFPALAGGAALWDITSNAPLWNLPGLTPPLKHSPVGLANLTIAN
jgi:hypothetical protein